MSDKFSMLLLTSRFCFVCSLERIKMSICFIFWTFFGNLIGTKTFPLHRWESDTYTRLIHTYKLRFWMRPLQNIFICFSLDRVKFSTFHVFNIFFENGRHTKLKFYSAAKLTSSHISFIHVELTFEWYTSFFFKLFTFLAASQGKKSHKKTWSLIAINILLHPYYVNRAVNRQPDFRSGDT